MRKLIWLLLLIVMVAFIFYNSSLPAVQSDGASRLLAITIINDVSAIVDYLLPIYCIC